MRLAVMFDNLGPYHIARLGSTAERCELMALEIRAVSGEYQWNATDHVAFSRSTLFSTDLRPADDYAELRRLIGSALMAHRSEVLAIPGWSGASAMAGLSEATRMGIPIVVMSESQEIDFHRSDLREFIKRRYLRLCRTALVGGAPQRNYLLKLGMPSERIWTGYDVVDNDYFATASDYVRENRELVQKKYGLPTQFFLASTRFIPKKNLTGLIRAFGAYRTGAINEQRAPWDLVIIGDGSLRPDLEATVKQLGLDGAVHMPGFQQYGQLPDYYGLAGAFVHLSTSEQWGLVVNEAMASGLPVLVSERCGCAQDLVQPGVNGFTVDPSNERNVTALLSSLAAPDLDREAMGQASRRIIAEWSPSRFGENMVAAANEARTLGAPRIRALDRLVLSLLARHADQLKADSNAPKIENPSVLEGSGDAVKNFFSSQTDSYSQHFRALQRGDSFRFVRRLQIACALTKPMQGHVLDCAVGSGEIAAAVISQGNFSSADLVDISPNMLARTRELTKSLDVPCSFVEEDIFLYARRAKLLARSYDLILCLGLIAHVGRLEELLSLLKPLLVPGSGRLILQSTVLDNPGVRLERLLSSRRYTLVNRYSISYFNRSEIVDSARRCGYEVVGETRFGLNIPFGDRIWPWANFHAERLLSGASNRIGGEIIFELGAR